MNDFVPSNAPSRYYAGIGSRETPERILTHMQSLGRRFAACGYILRSGGAPGADTAFEKGCDELNGKKEIYLPWRLFNGNGSTLFNISDDAYEMAKEFHPNWSRLGIAARKFMARNCYQVMGLDLNTPVDFIAYWTKDGKISGGTGQALRIAERYKIRTTCVSTDHGKEEL